MKTYNYTNPKKHLQSNKVFTIKQPQTDRRKRWKTLTVRPVDGEECYDQLGLSAGFIHWADPDTGNCLGFCGVTHFDENAIEVDNPVEKE